MANPTSATWQLAQVSSPHLPKAVEVVAAKDIPYIVDANRLQTLNIYVPKSLSAAALTGTPVTFLPGPVSPTTSAPYWQVHVHGGAWRDPDLTASSIEPAVAHAFSDESSPIAAIASINYSVSPFPVVPGFMTSKPYDPERDHHSDPAREARHPQHIRDVLSGFALLRSLGLADGSFILTGHSAGACLVMQTVLQPPSYFGLSGTPVPRPAAIAGLNGLYDLPALAHDIGSSHAHLGEEYARLQGEAFGRDEEVWAQASPARFDVAGIAERVKGGRAPTLVLLDQSADDQLVPVNQRERLEVHLKQVNGMKVVVGKRCKGKHAAPWEEGVMIWETVQDMLKLCDSNGGT